MIVNGCFHWQLGVCDHFWHKHFGAFTEKASIQGFYNLDSGFKGLKTWIWKAMTKQSTRRQRAERSQHEGSQEASSGANQTSVFITRDEMEMMMDAMQEGMLKRQEEMMQNLL